MHDSKDAVRRSSDDGRPPVAGFQPGEFTPTRDRAVGVDITTLPRDQIKDEREEAIDDVDLNVVSSG